MEIDEEFEQAITADVDVILQQPIVDTAERVEQLADVLLSYAEGETVCLCTHALAADRMHVCAPLLHHHRPRPSTYMTLSSWLSGWLNLALHNRITIACLTACRTSDCRRFGLAAASPADAHIHADPCQQDHRVCNRNCVHVHVS
jgi:hypothetical protein